MCGVNASRVGDDAIHVLMVGHLIVVVGIRVDRRPSDAVADAPIFMHFLSVYGVLPLVARDCDFSHNSAPSPICFGILCDIFSEFFRYIAPCRL